MPFDPCGMKVRMGTHTYTTKLRPFKDSSREVDIVWRPALVTAKVLPFPTFVVDLDEDVWERPLGIWRGRSVGEVVGAPRPFTDAEAIPGSGKGNFCGTAEMFRNGASYDPDANFPRQANGLPACCGPVPLLPVYYYRGDGFSTGVPRCEFYEPDMTPWPRWYDVVGLVVNPARVQHDYPVPSGFWEVTYPAVSMRYTLTKNITGFGVPGGWVLRQFFTSIPAQTVYLGSGWDGYGSSVFVKDSGFGPTTCTVTLVT